MLRCFSLFAALFADARGLAAVQRQVQPETELPVEFGGGARPSILRLTMHTSLHTSLRLRVSELRRNYCRRASVCVRAQWAHGITAEIRHQPPSRTSDQSITTACAELGCTARGVKLQQLSGTKRPAVQAGGISAQS